MPSSFSRALMRPAMSTSPETIPSLARFATKPLHSASENLLGLAVDRVLKMDRRLDAAGPTPLHDGFGWPAEWDRHRRTWMCWPARHECFGGPEGALRAKQAYARVARAVSGFEKVTLAARPADAAEARLATGGKVDVVEAALDDSWARDFGPTFLTGKGRLAGVHWKFNGWGQKYHPYTNDASFGRHVVEAAGAGLYAAPLTCEGGALHTDGQGTVLTTEQCLLNPNRNP